MSQPKPSPTPDELTAALQLFGLTTSCTRQQLDEKQKELLHTWNPHRYANVTNNPKKYMQSFKKGEAMTKEIGAAYDLLVAWLTTRAID